MLNKILVLSSILSLTTAISADEIAINPDHPEQYTVVKGDTLWDISGRFLEKPWRWPEVWDMNPYIENPHLIYPGDVISLRYIDGQPVFDITRAKDRMGQSSGRYVKLSPTIGSTENVQAIPTIPIEVIYQFLGNSLVLDEDEMGSWPYVVASYDKHLVAGKGDKIYIRGLPKDSAISRYSIYRKGPAYTNPEKNEKGDNEIIGYEAIYVGDARIERYGDPASAIVTSTVQEVSAGDRLLPQSDEYISTDFTLRSVEGELQGNIIAVVDGVSQVGQYQIVTLNLGAEQGIEPGNVLGVYQSSYVVQDRFASNLGYGEGRVSREAEMEKHGTIFDRTVYSFGHGIGQGVEVFDKKFPFIANKTEKPEPVSLPEEYVGVVMVFRTFNKVSHALVMETRAPVHVLDSVKNI